MFLSHAGRDRDAAAALADRLERSGLEVWLDVRALRPGDPWMETIERALDAADAFLVFVGSAGIDGWVGMELRVALDRAVQGPLRIVPVLGPGASGPEALPPFLRAYQALDLRSPEASLAPLVDALGVEGKAAPVLRPDEPPFRGLDPFDAADAHLFFGRDEEIQAVVSRLQAHPFLTVIGDSGTGKSSLIRAGVIPALHAGRLAEEGRWVDEWCVGVCRPGAEPVARLAAALADVAHPELAPGERESVRASFRSLLEGGPADIDALVGELPSSRRHLLVIDQFEEVFTQGAPVELRTRFFDLVTHLPSTAVRVILTLRADFYDECWEHRGLLERISERQYALPHMTAEQLRDVIEKPLVLAGLRMEEGLARDIVEDAGVWAGSLAVVQHALFELWRERSPEGVLTHAAYAAMGRLQGAIGTHAESVFGGLGAEGKALAERVFIRLADPRRRDVRRPASTEDLLALGDGAAMPEVLEDLLHGRLVVARRQGDLEFWEVAHEALIDNWPRYRQWLESQQAFYTWLEFIRSQVEGWERMGRHTSALLLGRPLKEAARWEKSHAIYLDGPERDFLRACRRRRWRRRAGWATAGVALAALAGLGVREIRANDARRWAADVRDRAREKAEEEPLAAALALAELPPLDAGEEASQLMADLTGLELPDLRWMAHPGGVVHLLPWGLRDEVVSTGADGRVLRWRVEGEAPEGEAWAGHEGRILAARPSGDGILLTGGQDGAVRLHGAGPGALPVVGAGDAILDALRLPSGRIVTRSGDRLRVWAGGLASDVDGPGESVGVVTARGERLVVGTPSGRVLEGAVDGGEWRLLTRHAAGVGAVGVDPATGTLFTAARDASARLLVPEGPSRELAHPSEVTAHTLAALGAGLLVTGTADGTVLLWSVSSSHDAPPAVVARADLGGGGSARRVTSVAASPSGDVVVAGSASGELVLWRRRDDGGFVGRALAGRGHGVTAVAVRPDGRGVVAGFADGVVEAWHPRDRVLEGVGEVRVSAVAPGGPLFLATDSAFLRLDHGERLPTEAWRRAGITRAAASADGSTVAVAAGDLLYLVDGGSGVVRDSVRSGASVAYIAVSDDGAYVAAELGGEVRVWNARGEPAGRHAHPVSALSWLRDGTLLLTGDETFWRWDPRDGSLETLADLGGMGFLEAAALSPDGQRVILAAGEDGIRSGAPGTGPGEEAFQLPAPANPDCGTGARFAHFLPGGGAAVVGTRGGLWRWRLDAEAAGAEARPAGPDTLALERNGRSRCIGGVTWSGDGELFASLPVSGGVVVAHGGDGTALRLTFPGNVRGGAFRDGGTRFLAWTADRELDERALTWDGMVADLRAHVKGCLTVEERQVLLQESYRRARARTGCVWEPAGNRDEEEP